MTGRRAIGAALAASSGFAMAVQARVNGELAVQLGDGIAAAVVSFGTGLVVLSVVVLGSAPGRRGLRAVRAAAGAGSLRWWHFLGGVCGAFVVASQGLTVAAIGVAVFTVALVAGQSSSGLAVDRSGVAPSGTQRVTTARVAGAGLCVVAVLVAVGDQLGTPQTLGLAALPLLAGVGIAWQQAVNGRVRMAAGSTWPATMINFLTGTVALLLGFSIWTAMQGWPVDGLPTQPWLYTGGLLGVLVIAVAAAVVRFTGVLLLALSTISGQLLGALAVDLLVPADTPPSVNTYAGAALAVVAVMIALSPPRWTQWRQPAPVEAADGHR